MNRNIRVSVLLFRDNELLVVNMKRKESDCYVLPGGSLEKEESIFQAGIREVKEETNLDISIIKTVYIKELYTDKDEAIDIILLGKINGSELRKGFDPEHSDNQALNEVLWIKIDNLNQINFHPKQLISRLKLDMNNNFQDGTIHLGRYKYPESDKL